jgi:chromosome segregation ATPase
MSETKTRADVEKLIALTESEINVLTTQTEQLNQSQNAIELKLAELEIKRNGFEDFINATPTMLAEGKLSLDEFAKTGDEIDKLTFEINRLERVHEGSSSIIKTNDNAISELQGKLYRQKKALCKVAIKELGVSIATKARTDIEQLTELLKSLKFNETVSPLLGAEILSGLDLLKKAAAKK